VPGNIRRAEHFVAFLRRFVAYLKQRMEVQQVESETPTSFLSQIQGQVAIDGGRCGGLQLICAAVKILP
jgi:DNA excision repair protein ERCC-2